MIDLEAVPIGRARLARGTQGATRRATTGRSPRRTSSTPASPGSGCSTPPATPASTGPSSYGGRGLTPEHNAAWIEECARAGVPAVPQHGRARARRRLDPAVRHPRSRRPTTCGRRSRPSRCGASSSASPAPAATSAALDDAGRARRRPLHRQRPEGVVQRRALQRLGHPHGPHRPRRAEAPGHLVLPRATWTCPASRSGRCGR